MMLAIADILSASELGDAIATLGRAHFADGRATAGWSARDVKNNKQADDNAALNALRELIQERLSHNTTFSFAARPKRIIGPLFSRYRSGNTYGEHIDEPIMDGVRSDISFTLFLSPPETYDGGELVIVTTAGEDAVKLPAGSAFVYPATTLHRVTSVTGGERLAAVGWVRSYIRSAEHREILFDLEMARREMFERHGRSAAFERMSKSAANLMRLWCED